MRIARGAVVGLLMALGAPALAEEASDAAAPLGAVLSDQDLAGASGLGIAIDRTAVIGSDGSLVVLGAGNSAALADANGTVNGEVNADTVTAGNVQNLSASNLRGFNVLQVNTAPNVNQLVSQAVNIYIVDGGSGP